MQGELMSKSLLLAPGSQSCWGPLKDSIKVLQNCVPLLFPISTPELGSCSIYPLTLVHPWVTDTPRGISSSPLLSAPHIEAAEPEKAMGIRAGQ